MTDLKLVPDEVSHDDLNIAVLISGRGSNLKALIEVCEVPNFPAKIGLVISNKKDAAGLKFADEASIAYHFIDYQKFPDRQAFDMAIHAELLAAGVNFICLAGWMKVLTADFVEKWFNRLINIHPSLLPKYPGLDTHKRALTAGEQEHGCTVHFVRAEVDAGPIIVQEIVKISAGETEESLAAKVLKKEHEAYQHALRIVAERRYVISGDKVDTWD